MALFLTLLMTDALSSTVGKLLVYHPPVTQALAVPFSILLAFSRMQRDNELKAVLASGIRPLPILLFLSSPVAAAFCSAQS